MLADWGCRHNASYSAALASGDRNTILALAAQLDAYNNFGCPLN